MSISRCDIRVLARATLCAIPPDSSLAGVFISAESPSFVFGSLFNEKVHEAPAVVEKDEKDKNTADMPKSDDKKSTIDVDVDL